MKFCGSKRSFLAGLQTDRNLEEGELTRNGQPVRHTAEGSPPVIAMNADAADSALHNHLALPGCRVRALPSPAYRLALAAGG